MKIKKLLFTTLLATLATLLLASCEKNNKSITDYDKDKLSITTYADDTEVSGGFSFTATEAWTTAIDYGTAVRSDNSNWITVDPASGNAGEVTITITLDENTTGEDRNATIKIICGDTTLSIEIEQRSSENPGDNNGTQENDSTSTGEVGRHPCDAKIAQIIEIDDSGVEIIINIERKNKEITRLWCDNATEEDDYGNVSLHKVEYVFERDGMYWMNVYGYYDGKLSGKVEAFIDGRYVERMTVYEYDPENDGQLLDEDYYTFKRNANGTIDYTEDWNSDKSAVADVNKFTWEDATINIDDGWGNYKYTQNLTQLSWNNEKINTYLSYNTELNVFENAGGEYASNKGFIDLNQLIYEEDEGLYFAFGGCFPMSLCGLIAPPNYNMVSRIKTVSDEYQSISDVEYGLDEHNRITSINVIENGYVTERYKVVYEW